MNTRTSFTKTLAALTMTSALSVFAGAAGAADNYWTNANGTNRWAESGNWSLGRVPNTTDHAIVAWGPNSTSVIVDTTAVCGRFSNGNNQTIISGNGYLIVHSEAYIAGGLFMYGSFPVLETRGSTLIDHGAQFYSGTLRQVNGGEVTFGTYNTATLMPGGSGLSIEGGAVHNAGVFEIKNTGLTIGNYYDSDPFTVFENQFAGRVKVFVNTYINDPSTGSHNGGNSVIVNRGQIEFFCGGHCAIEADIQFWQLENGRLDVTNATGLDIRNPVNLDVNDRLTGGYWNIKDSSYVFFASGGRYISQLESDATVFLDGPTAHMYGIDQLTQVRGTLAVVGGRTLQLLPLAPVTQTAGHILVGSGSQVQIAQSFTQTGGLIRRVAAVAADKNLPAIVTSGSASVYGDGMVDLFDISLSTPNALFKVVTGGWGVGGAFSTTSINTGDGTGFYTASDAMIRVAPPCPCDLNGDSRIDTADLVIFLGEFGTTKTSRFEGADFNGDFVIDTADLVIFLGRFGIAC